MREAQIWPIFCLVFQFLRFKSAFFWLWCLIAQFVGFLQFSLWFSVVVNNGGSFSTVLSSAFYDFCGFAKLHPAVALKLEGQGTTFIAFYPFF